MKKITLLLITLLIAFSFLVIGCTNSQKEDTVKNDNKSQIIQTEDNEIKKEIILYYPDESGEYLIASKHIFEIDPDDKDDNLYEDIVEELIEGPDNPREGVSVIPKKTKVLGVVIKNKIAYVNLSKYFETHFPGGSTSEIMIIGSIVDTLTNLEEIDKVQILVEGKKIDSLSGHFDLTSPLKRMPNLIKKY